MRRLASGIGFVLLLVILGSVRFQGVQEDEFLSMTEQNQIVQTILDEAFRKNNNIEDQYTSRVDYIILSTRNLNHSVVVHSLEKQVLVLSREEILDLWRSGDRQRFSMNTQAVLFLLK